uniref:Uncharacterized protein n=1 Tax=Romanomermis culicivorax TaxID=13658 RepID=A0A915HW16_ROMCU
MAPVRKNKLKKEALSSMETEKDINEETTSIEKKVNKEKEAKIGKRGRPAKPKRSENVEFFSKNL